MEFLLEIFLEFLLQIIGEVLIDVVLHAASRFAWVRETLNALMTAVMYVGLGLLIGFLSVSFFPKAFIRSSTLHGISLLITPVLAGFTMSAIGWIRVRRGNLLIRLESFSYGFIFAFAMALIRLMFTA
jgi:hypothetical protein